ncbi:MgtC/SapB family protein [Ferruginibacter sp. HRS2-29]|uniref:MgtC/SapB family protein n=1 Tax=Ferruginibacter sp. HRS2-29 TaxID=2487334 RepID=UPI0020CF68C4|nr:MgtC/SapB family protein [Ferruginibacter sp. HRS2-29]MCP9752078.1 MgtC/SapB family protein [Ferruginibacter sp. HRS2-29]
MDFTIYFEEAAQVLFAFIIGSIIGLEREFRSKPAGFRTMILICVGSCLYTIISREAGTDSSDRIASNIVTGIGFIGAGVIFKEGITVNGLTTAALIWITAALGMAIGYHNYPIAIVVSGIVVIVLFVLEPVQRFINRFHKVKDYKIRTVGLGNNFKTEVESFFEKHDLAFNLMKALKDNNDVVYLYRIGSPDRSYDLVNDFLIKHKEVKSFEV